MKKKTKPDVRFPEWSKADEVTTIRRCHMCNCRVTEDEYCYGCKAHICGNCDAPLDERPFGYVHIPAMHLQAS